MQQKYDVFLSFRGEDVRNNFLSHLVAALNRASLEIFVDDKIKRGDEISLALMSAIENSKLAITIFSENYATSRWCLNELVKVMECRENPRIRLIVIPVFYHVSTADVKSQRGSFAKAFADHENSEYPDNRRNVPIWKAAMKKASSLAGRTANEKSPENDVVVDIVNDVLKALGRLSMENKVNDSSNTIKLIQSSKPKVIRRTYDNCHEVRVIFRALRVLVDERNTNAVPEYMKELKNVLKKNFCLPKVFINGRYIVGCCCDQGNERKWKVEEPC